MMSFVVFAAGSQCGPITIKAQNPDEAATLYSENCYAANGSIWVWKLEDYNTDPNQRPEPFEYTFNQGEVRI